MFFIWLITQTGFFVLPMPLVAVVCGLEHSGTTLTRYILDSAPHVFSPFELGLLMSEPSKFGHPRAPHTQPWATWLMQAGFHSGCPQGTAHRIRECNNHAQAYAVYDSYRGKNQKNTHIGECVATSTHFVDKAPAYIYQLPHVFARLNRAHLDVPVFIPLKHPDDLIRSYARRGMLLALTRRLKRATESLSWMLRHAPTRAFPFKLIPTHEETSTIKAVAPVMHVYSPQMYSENTRISIDSFKQKLNAAALRMPYVSYCRKREVSEFANKVPRELHNVLNQYSAIRERAIQLGVQNTKRLMRSVHINRAPAVVHDVNIDIDEDVDNSSDAETNVDFVAENPPALHPY